MSAYALEASKEVKKGVPVTQRMKQIIALKEVIESMKNKIVLVGLNDKMPYVLKTSKLEQMQKALRQTQQVYHLLMEEELLLNSLDSDDCDGDGNDGHDE